METYPAQQLRHFKWIQEHCQEHIEYEPVYFPAVDPEFFSLKTDTHEGRCNLVEEPEIYEEIQK